MSRALLTILASLSLATLVNFPAHADQTAPPAPQAGSEAAAPDAGSKPGKDTIAPSQPAVNQVAGASGRGAPGSTGQGPAGKSNPLNLMASLPVRLASFTVGTTVGTPIYIVRRARREALAVSEEIVGASDEKMPFWLTVSSIGLPLGILSGSCDGFFGGIGNSWRFSGAKPFSKEVFSLGEDQ